MLNHSPQDKIKMCEILGSCWPCHTATPSKSAIWHLLILIVPHSKSVMWECIILLEVKLIKVCSYFPVWKKNCILKHLQVTIGIHGCVKKHGLSNLQWKWPPTQAMQVYSLLSKNDTLCRLKHLLLS